MVLNFVWPSSKVVIPRNACEEDYTYSCRTQCLEGEEEAIYSCGTKAGKCCKPVGVTPGCTELKDCLDRNCRGATVTDATGKTGKCELSESLCNDNFDNDADTRIDAADEDCKEEKCLDKHGKVCPRNEECDEPVIRTTDTDKCCTGTCVAATKTCAEQDGVDCEGQECKDDAWLGASDTFFCCSTECKSKTNILPFIIIALILALAAGAFFLYKKGFFRKKFVPPKIMPPSAGAYKPPVRPLTPQFPISQQQQRPVDIRLKFQPQAQAQRPPFSEKAAPRKETKSELDETLKKLKKLAEEK